MYGVFFYCFFCFDRLLGPKVPAPTACNVSARPGGEEVPLILFPVETIVPGPWGLDLLIFLKHFPTLYKT